MFTRRWWIIARSRATRSMAQVLILTAGPTAAGWMEINWVYLAYATIGAGILSLAHSTAKSPVPVEDRE